jgi:hypothetical protein
MMNEETKRRMENKRKVDAKTVVTATGVCGCEDPVDHKHYVLLIEGENEVLVLGDIGKLKREVDNAWSLEQEWKKAQTTTAS